MSENREQNLESKNREQTLETAGPSSGRADNASGAERSRWSRPMVREMQVTTFTGGGPIWSPSESPGHRLPPS